MAFIARRRILFILTMTSAPRLAPTSRCSDSHMGRRRAPLLSPHLLLFAWLEVTSERRRETAHATPAIEGLGPCWQLWALICVIRPLGARESHCRVLQLKRPTIEFMRAHLFAHGVCGVHLCINKTITLTFDKIKTFLTFEMSCYCNKNLDNQWMTTTYLPNKRNMDCVSIRDSAVSNTDLQTSTTPHSPDYQKEVHVPDFEDRTEDWGCGGMRTETDLRSSSFTTSPKPSEI